MKKQKGNKVMVMKVDEEKLMTELMVSAIEKKGVILIISIDSEHIYANFSGNADRIKHEQLLSRLEIMKLKVIEVIQAMDSKDSGGHFQAPKKAESEKNGGA